MLKCESASRRFQPGEGPSRGLLRDCTTGCGTDGALHSTNLHTSHLVVFTAFALASQVGTGQAVVAAGVGAAAVVAG